MKSLLLAIALIGASAAAAAQHNPTPSGEEAGHNQTQSPREAAKSEDEKAERICRWVSDADVGSLIRGRTRRCLTEEQWRAVNRRR